MWVHVKLWSRTAAALIGVALALAIVSSPLPAKAGTTSATEDPFDDVCELAEQLAQNDPAAAVKLILAVRAADTPGATPARRSACSDALDIALASNALDTGLELSSGGACAAAGRLLELDRKKAAKAVLQNSTSASSAFEACPESFKAAGAEVPATTPKLVGTSWDEFIKDSVSPLASTGTFLLGAWAALIVLARLIAFLPHLSDQKGSTRSKRRENAVVGWAFVVAAPPFAWWVSTLVMSDAWSRTVWLGLILVCIGGIGSWMLARVIATSPRLSIEVTGDGGDKTLDNAVVAGVIRDMMGAAAVGIELPVGPDLKDMSDALTQLSDQKWIAVLQKVWLFLTNVRPWRLAVAVKTAAVATLAIERNGRQIFAARIEAKDGRTGDSTAEGGITDAQRIAAFAAARLVAVMAERYPEMGQGLHGATEARGIALQYIATLGYRPLGDRDAALSLLGQAVEADPRNATAVFTLRYRESRDSAERGALLAYRNWLLSFCGRRMDLQFGEAMPEGSITAPGRAAAEVIKSEIDRAAADTTSVADTWAEDELLVRALATLSSVNRNLEMTAPPSGEAAWPAPQPLAASMLLRGILQRRSALDIADPDHDKRTALVSIDIARFQGNTIAESSSQPEAPIVAYSLGCYYAATGRDATDQELEAVLDSAVPLLSRAFTDAELKEWAERDDPELEPLRGRPRFEALFGRARDPRLGRKPFLMWSVRLNSVESVATLEGLARSAVDGELLGKLNKVSSPGGVAVDGQPPRDDTDAATEVESLRRLARAAAVALLFRETPLDGFEWAALEWLHERDILTSPQLLDLSKSSTRVDPLVRALEDEGAMTPKAKVIDWLSDLAASLTVSESDDGEKDR